MKDFLDNYVRLRDRDIRPFFCVNHGPTKTMYYRDTDGTFWVTEIGGFGTDPSDSDLAALTLELVQEIEARGLP